MAPTTTTEAPPAAANTTRVGTPVNNALQVQEHPAAEKPAAEPESTPSEGHATTSEAQQPDQPSGGAHGMSSAPSTQHFSSSHGGYQFNNLSGGSMNIATGGSQYNGSVCNSFPRTGGPR